LINRAAVFLLGLVVMACTHFPGARKGSVHRLGVVIIDEGFVDNSAVSEAQKQQRTPPYNWEQDCKKRFLTRYTRVHRKQVAGKRFGWLLVNSCDALPTKCPAGSKLAIEFKDWQYTSRILNPGEDTTDYSQPGTGPKPFEEMCVLRKSVFRNVVVPLTCKFAPGVKSGSYKFQAVLSCDGVTIDNWDPEIILDDEDPKPDPEGGDN
jgi:hypothetical protein